MNTTFVDDQQREYRAIRTLDEGGDAPIYLVVDTTNGHEVALKVLKADAGKRLKTTFRREADTLQRLNQLEKEMQDGKYAFPRLRGTQFHSDAPSHFIVMEWIEGVRVTDYLKHHNPPSEGEALTIARDLLRVLRVLHADDRPYPDMDLDALRVTPLDAPPVSGIKVMNWNTLSKRPDPNERLVALKEADIARAATFLFRLLTGQSIANESATEAKLSVMAGESQWHTLSWASRWLLQTALHPNGNRRFATAEGFEIAIQQVLELHAKPTSGLVAVEGDIEDAMLFYKRLQQTTLSAPHLERLAGLEVKITSALDLASRRSDVDQTRLQALHQQWHTLQLGASAAGWHQLRHHFVSDAWRTLTQQLESQLEVQTAHVQQRGGSTAEVVTESRSLFDVIQRQIETVVQQLDAFIRGDAVMLDQDLIKEAKQQFEAEIRRFENTKKQELAEIEEKFAPQFEALQSHLSILHANLEADITSLAQERTNIEKERQTYRDESLQLQGKREDLNFQRRTLEQDKVRFEEEKTQLDLITSAHRKDHDLLIKQLDDQIALKKQELDAVQSAVTDPLGTQVARLPKSETVVVPPPQGDIQSIYQKSLFSLGKLSNNYVEAAKIEAQYISDADLRNRVVNLIFHLQTKDIVQFDSLTQEIYVRINGQLQNVEFDDDHSNADLHEAVTMLKAITSKPPSQVIRDFSIVNVIREARNNADEGKRSLNMKSIAKNYYLRAYAFGVLGQYLALFIWRALIPAKDGPPKLGEVAKLLNEITEICEVQGFLPYSTPLSNDVPS